MDLNIILASTQSQAARDYAMRLTQITNASEIIGDVWHHADQILTYTSGVILGTATKHKNRMTTRVARYIGATTNSTQVGTQYVWDLPGTLRQG